jgi:hypothetical protein
MAPFTPELQFLALAAAQCRGLISKLKIPSQVQEDELLDLAFRHKVQKDLHSFLALHPDLLSEKTRSKLKTEVRIQTLKTSLLVQEWGRVSAALGAAGFPLLSLKGPALSCQLFKEPTVRGGWDLDFVTSSTRLRDLIKTMSALGYTLFEELGNKTLSDYQFKLVSRVIHHIEFMHHTHPLRIEIHTRTWKETEDAFPVTVPTLFASAQALTWKDQTFQIPGKGYHYAYVIAHGGSHEWCLLHWILDFAAIWNNATDAQWLELQEVVDRLAIRPYMQAAWLLVQDLFELRERPQTFEKKPSLTVQKYAQFCRSQLQDAGRHGHLQYMARMKFAIAMNGKGRLAWLMKVINTLLSPYPADVANYPFPKGLEFLIYFLRPFLSASRVLMRGYKSLKRKFS